MPAAIRHLQQELEIGNLPIIAYNGGLILVEGEVRSSTEIPLDILEELYPNEFF
jgi:hydroxymethylpyrimidine pyrophosphatase-like HAD family hydrolase